MWFPSWRTKCSNEWLFLLSFLAKSIGIIFTVPLLVPSWHVHLLLCGIDDLIIVWLNIYFSFLQQKIKASIKGNENFYKLAELNENFQNYSSKHMIKSTLNTKTFKVDIISQHNNNNNMTPDYLPPSSSWIVTTADEGASVTCVSAVVIFTRKTSSTSTISSGTRLMTNSLTTSFMPKVRVPLLFW